MLLLLVVVDRVRILCRDLRSQLSAFHAINSKVEQLSSTHDVLSSALKSQLDAQRSASASQQEQLCAVLSRVDSVLDRTASALSSSQVQLREADDAISQAKQQASSKRMAHKAKRKAAGGQLLEAEAEAADNGDEVNDAGSHMPRVEEEESTLKRRLRTSTMRRTKCMPSTARTAEHERRCRVRRDDPRTQRAASRTQKGAEEQDIVRAHQPRAKDGGGAATSRHTKQTTAAQQTYKQSG